jgi:purine-nucleoside phosphorylase
LDRLRTIKEAVAAIQERTGTVPEIGMILGSGLGDLADEITGAVVIDYADIPNFPQSTVEGHAGKLVIGDLEGRKVVAMQGRFHYYEGYSMQDVVLPVYVMHQLGVKLLVVTNACGGMNPQFTAGDLMIIEDHINFTGDNPLRGPNLEELGPRFPDMSRSYTPELVRFAIQTAQQLDINVQKGVYVGISGPNFLPKAELSMLAKLGADAVGMSTVPEVIASSHAGLQVLGISCVTDMAIADELEGISHEEVMEVAARTKPKFISFVKQLIRKANIR